jgi:hypothetical protein
VVEDGKARQRIFCPIDFGTKGTAFIDVAMPS